MGFSRLARSSNRSRIRSRRKTILQPSARGRLITGSTIPCPEVEALARFGDPPQPQSNELDHANDCSTTAQKVTSALSGLSVLEFEVVNALFPPSGSPLSHEEIASKFGLAISEVREIEANALRNLRGGRLGPRRGGSAPWN